MQESGQETVKKPPTAARAFVFINTYVGTENEVLSVLRDMEEVKESHVVYGVYDLATRMTASSLEELKKAIQSIRENDWVRSTLTMVIIEN